MAAEQLDKEQQLKETIKSAFVYPTAVVITAVGVVTFLLIFVVPVFANVYDQFHAELPAPTKILVALSKIITKFWWMVGAMIYGAIKVFKKWEKTDKGRKIAILSNSKCRCSDR